MNNSISFESTSIIAIDRDSAIRAMRKLRDIMIDDFNKNLPEEFPFTMSVAYELAPANKAPAETTEIIAADDIIVKKGDVVCIINGSPEHITAHKGFEIKIPLA